MPSYVKHFEGSCGREDCSTIVAHYHSLLAQFGSPAAMAFLEGPKALEAFRAILPTSNTDRKALPVWDGTFGYFPDALIEVARVSKLGNDQHNPGEPLRWAREKSTDQFNTAIRHILDHTTGTPKDTDDSWHLAKAAWRILAALQLAIEKEKK